MFFHLVQNLKKKLGKHHLRSRYENDADFAVQCRMITSMAFVPPQDLLRFLPSFGTDAFGTGTEPKHEGAIGMCWWSQNSSTHCGTSTTELWMEVTEQTTMPKPPITESKMSLMCAIPGYGTLSTACEWCNKEETINHPVASRQATKGKATQLQKADTRILSIVEQYAVRNTEEYLKGLQIIMIWMVENILYCVCYRLLFLTKCTSLILRLLFNFL
uniref:Uncharacterized protein n=1 Tax=Ditylenchus dipsaci TaxID=166011 RepID=A0A915ELT8_9BILA